jgi:hypothetical protein
MTRVFYISTPRVAGHDEGGASPAFAISIQLFAS